LVAKTLWNRRLHLRPGSNGHIDRVEIGAILDSACQSFDPGKFPSDKAFGQAPLIYRIHAFAAGGKPSLIATTENIL
jgi:hypothetical protein